MIHSTIIGYYTTNGSAGCEVCLTGGVCRGGQIVGVAPGYYYYDDDGEIVFYPCSRDHPSTKEQLAALDACPGNTTELEAPCGTGYTGPRCLVCDSGYGFSGPYCEG